MEVWGPIGEGRRGSVPGAKQHIRPTTPSKSPSLKPSPTTTTTLTNGSDYTSQASAALPSSASSSPPPPIAIPRRNSSITSVPQPLSNDGGSVASAPSVRKTGRKPLYIREGGSIPSIRFLEKEFGAPAAHLPCGQASDAAHLDNERLRLANLYRSREIFGKVFGRLGSR